MAQVLGNTSFPIAGHAGRYQNLYNTLILPQGGFQIIAAPNDLLGKQ